MNGGRAARAGTLALLTGVWVAAALLLWRSSVVPSLRLPHLDEHRYFSAAQLRATASFGRFSLFIWVLATLAELVALAVYARKGGRFARESAAGRLGTGMLLGMLGFALVWAVQLPFDVAGLWWQRRHHLTHVGYLGEIFGNWLALGGQFVFLCFALAIVMGLASQAASALVGRRRARLHRARAALRLHQPVPPHDAPPWRPGAARGRRCGSSGSSTCVTSRSSSKTCTTSRRCRMPRRRGSGRAGGSCCGTPSSRDFTPREITVVLAHELGHLAHNHIWKSIGWYALFAFPGLYLIARATRRKGGMANPQAVPLSLFVLVALTLAAQPLQNAISRHMEAEADWAALEATHDPAGATQLFRRFVPTTLDEPNPSTFDYVLLENHPTIMQRIAMAQAWRSRHGR